MTVSGLGVVEPAGAGNVETSRMRLFLEEGWDESGS